MTARPLCVGLWRLFDSMDVTDHERAAALCALCPVRTACADRLVEAQQNTLHHRPKYGPVGTWAGQLVGGQLDRTATEERMFTDEEARLAHRRHAAGVRDDRTCIGERVYQRRIVRARRARERAA